MSLGDYCHLSEAEEMNPLCDLPYGKGIVEEKFGW
jgi:hypothetical protein